MSRRPFFLFTHGWSGSASIWDAVRAALPDADVALVEHGYMGATPHRPVVPDGAIAVGHSAGTLELLLDPPPNCAGLVSINGFTRFTAAPGFPDGIPTRFLDRMLDRLGTDPEAVVTEFRRRCGIRAASPGRPSPDLLRTGLLALRDGDARDRPLRRLALAADDDPIVPPALTQACFAPADTAWQPKGGHLLPVTRPEWCAARLRAFAG